MNVVSTLLPGALTVDIHDMHSPSFTFFWVDGGDPCHSCPPFSITAHRFDIEMSRILILSVPTTTIYKTSLFFSKQYISFGVLPFFGLPQGTVSWRNVANLRPLLRCNVTRGVVVWDAQAGMETPNGSCWVVELVVGFTTIICGRWTVFWRSYSYFSKGLKETT